MGKKDSVVKERPDVGDGILAENANWSFKEAAGNFDRHVVGSVPLYTESHDLICQISDFFVRDDSLVYDLGCSTGVLAEKLLATHSSRKNMRYIGIDVVEEMVKIAADRIRHDKRAAIVRDNAILHDLEPCSIVISYYTMQFISPSKRQEVFNKIYNALEWGGALLLFEKVRGPDARFQDILVQLYQDYKLERGFTEKEIIHKGRSLKGVLEPFSTQGNIDLMKRAGFVDITTVMKWVCFEGFLAIK